ncbi:hypothetical protein [Spirosoma panaciterrae]|uniref:hypothetical protein n=1 Tax=Spirosoma panaciterrae TaxID=496058 RepID=UPI001B7FE9A4|nr:hypothetical protein [Spirosoma panaciterrae]
MRKPVGECVGTQVRRTSRGEVFSGECRNTVSVDKSTHLHPAKQCTPTNAVSACWPWLNCHSPGEPIEQPDSSLLIMDPGDLFRSGRLPNQWINL